MKKLRQGDNMKKESHEKRQQKISENVKKVWREQCKLLEMQYEKGTT